LISKPQSLYPLLTTFRYLSVGNLKGVKRGYKDCGLEIKYLTQGLIPR